MLLLGVAAALFFWPVTLAGFWLPAGGGDLASFLWPNYRFAARTLWQGEIPLWNPHLYAGAPFLADNQTGVLYPFNLLAFALFGEPSYGVMQGLSIFHIWWAGLGCYALARWTGASFWAGLIAGLAFMFCDALLTHVGNLNLIAVAAWLPWIFLGLTCAFAPGRLNRTRLAAAALCGVAAACAALAGHAQLTLIVAIAAAAFVLYRLVEAGLRRDWRGLARGAGLSLLIGAIAFGLSALTILPALEMVGWTARSGMSYDDAARFSLNANALTGAFSPLLFGRGPGGFWAPWDRVGLAYVGVLPLMLAIVGVAWRPGWARAQPLPTLFLLLTLALAAALALGPQTPLHRLAYEVVPGFRSVRAPGRFLVLTGFALALLAARGFDALPHLRGRAWRIALIALGVAGALGMVGAFAVVIDANPGLASPARARAAGVAVGAFLALWAIGVAWIAARRRGALPGALAGALAAFIVWADATALGSTVEVEFRDPTRGFDHPAITEFLRADPGHFRIEGDAGAWQPNTAEVIGVDDIGGIYNPLALAHFQTYRWSMGEKGSPLHDFLGVKYLLWDKGVLPADRSFVKAFDGDPAIDVLLNTGVLSRAQVITDVIPVSSGEEAFAAIHASGFDPARQVVLPREALDTPDTSETSAAPARVTFIRRAPHELVLDAQAPAPAYLVLPEVFYPGWVATVDGAPAQIWQANFAFRAVPLQAGNHRVVMRFEPDSWKTGAAISLITLAGLGAFFIGLWLLARNRRSRPMPASSQPAAKA